MRGATTFHKFLELPKELQLTIWELAVPAEDARVVKIASLPGWDIWPKRIRPKYALTQTIPGVLQACFNSRTEALKRYELSFFMVNIFLEVKPLFFDYKHDTLEFEDFEALEHFSLLGPSIWGISADRILTLAITINSTLQPHHFTLICSNFCKLKDLIIRERGFSQRAGASLTLLDSQEIERYLPWGTILALIRSKIAARCEKSVGTWKPPNVAVGTEKQWELVLQAERESVNQVEEMDWDEELL